MPVCASLPEKTTTETTYLVASPIDFGYSSVSDSLLQPEDISENDVLTAKTTVSDSLVQPAAPALPLFSCETFEKSNGQVQPGPISINKRTNRKVAFGTALIAIFVFILLAFLFIVFGWYRSFFHFLFYFLFVYLTLAIVFRITIYSIRRKKDFIYGFR
jgi:hypothetical protein